MHFAIRQWNGHQQINYVNLPYVIITRQNIIQEINIMKKTLILALACTLGLAIAGCGSEEAKTVPENQEKVMINQPEEKAEAPADEAGINAEALANALKDELTYKDTLTAVDLETAKMFLNLADVEVEESYIYESSGATAEEIVVLKCKDKDSAANAMKALEQRISEQTENFTDYVPEEVPKLNSAVVAVKDVYAVLSVSEDSSKAKEVVIAGLK